MNATCPVCHTGSVKKIKKPYLPNPDLTLPALPNVEMSRCSECQEEFLSPEQARDAAIPVKNAVRQMSGLLAPDRIAMIREKLRLTQVQLARLLNQGPKVVGRWESGHVIQNKSADTLLRMLERHPELFDMLQTIEQEREEEQHVYSRALQRSKRQRLSGK